MKPGERWNLGVGVLGLVACALLNVWVFRYGILYGLVGLNLTKHVGVAVICQAVGVDKGKSPTLRRRTVHHAPHQVFAGHHVLTRDTK